MFFATRSITTLTAHHDLQDSVHYLMPQLALPEISPNICDCTSNDVRLTVRIETLRYFPLDPATAYSDVQVDVVVSRTLLLDILEDDLLP